MDRQSVVGGGDVWNMLTSGFRRMANGLRRTIYGVQPDEKQLPGIPDLVSSNAWAIPVAGVASGLVFREQIEDLIEDIIDFIGKIKYNPYKFLNFQI